MARREEKLNSKLRDMLKQAGLSAEWESEHRGNKSIDIEVTLNSNIRVAVECEKHGQTKKNEAVKDATSRLLPTRLVEASMAVVYPKQCDKVHDLTPDTVLEYSIITMADARRYHGDYRKHAKHTTWYEVRASGLADVIKNLPRELGDPDQMVVDLKNRLHEGAKRLTSKQRQSLTRAIHLESGNEQSAARRALLVVASASLFHARLGDHLHDMKPQNHDGSWPPMPLGECIGQPNTVTALQKAWRMILLVDYKPIFEAALSVLNSTTSPEFTEVVRDLSEWAAEAAGRIGGMRHDLLGRIFHAMLDSAKNDGSFYTSVPAAILLAGLTIQDRTSIPSNLKEMRIMDPACGTGTLLMAAAERVEDLLKDEYDATTMIENVLSGTDINVTALHMAATTLGLLSPTTRFSRMDIRQAPFGLLVKPERVNKKKLAGAVAAGSLELYDSGGLDAHFNWSGRGADNIESGERRSNYTYKHSVDCVIMNPPFTRHDLRHDQLGANAKQQLILREREIFSKAPVNPDKTSSGIMFLVLGEYLTKQSGTLACVLPLSGASNPSTKPVRQFLARCFHVDTIVTAHDPNRFWFSENTNIGEMLVILRRSTDGRTDGRNAVQILV